MATKTISQRIALEGAEDIKRNLAAVGSAGERAFEQMRRAGANLNFQTLSRDLAAVGTSAGRVAQDASRLSGEAARLGAALQSTSAEALKVGSSLAQSGAGANQASSAFNSTSTSLSSLVKVATGVVAALGVVGAAILKVAKDAASAAAEINKEALKADVDLDDYQQAIFVLKQLGLSGDEAAAALKKAGEVGSTAFETGKAKLKELNTVFPDTEDGAAKAARQIENLNKILLNGKKPIDDLTAAAVKFRDGLDIKSLAAFADQLSKMKESAAQTLAEKVFGEEIGRVLLPNLRKGGAGIRDLLKDFENLRLGVDETQAAIGARFVAAMERFKDATKQGRTELGLLFAPITTDVIRVWTDLIRQNREVLKEWATTIGSVVISAVKDFFALMKNADAQVENKWLITLRDGIVSLGASVKSVFDGVLRPAFTALVQILSTVAKSINEFFGTKLTAADVGIASVLTFLVGGFNALGAAILAVFGSVGPAIDAFKERLKSIGIDIDAIRNTFIAIASSIGKELPAILLGVAAGLLVFSKAIRLIGAEKAVLLWLSQVTGILPTLTTLVVGAAAAFSILFGALTLIISTLSLLVGGPAAVAIAFGLAAFAIINGWEPLRDLLKAIGVDVDALESRVGLTKVKTKLEELKKVGEEKGWFAAILEGLKQIDEATATDPKAFKQLFDFLSSEVGKLVDRWVVPLKKFSDDAAELLRVGFSKAFDLVVDLFSTMLGKLLSPWSVLVDQLIVLWEKFLAVVGRKPETPTPSLTDGMAQPLLSPSGGGLGFDNPDIPLSDNIEDRRGEGAAMVEQFRAASEQIRALLEEANTALAVFAARAVENITFSFGLIGPAVHAAMALITEKIAAGMAAISQQITASGEVIGQALQTPFQTAADGVKGIMDGLGALIDAAFAKLNAAIDAAAAQVQAAINAIIASLQAALAQAQALAAAAAAAGSGGGGSGGGGDDGFAAGGAVRGPGSGTSDSILAWLSNGEYVLRAGAVRRLGVSYLDSLNSGRASLKMLRGFKLGGLVDGLNQSLSALMIPRYAAGGLASMAPGAARSSFTLQLPDGRQFQVQAATDAVEAVGRWAALAQIGAAGKLAR